MKNLKVGDVVGVVAIAERNYIGDFRHQADLVVSSVPVEPFYGIICGMKRIMLGTWHAASSGPDEDFEPAQMSVTGSVVVWLVRIGWLNTPIPVHDGDLVPSDRVVDLPMMAVRPQRKALGL
jgi:hypothetical protein